MLSIYHSVRIPQPGPFRARRLGLYEGHPLSSRSTSPHQRHAEHEMPGGRTASGKPTMFAVGKNRPSARQILSSEGLHPSLSVSHSVRIPQPGPFRALRLGLYEDHRFPLALPHQASVILSEPSDVDLCPQCLSECASPIGVSSPTSSVFPRCHAGRKNV